MASWLEALRRDRITGIVLPPFLTGKAIAVLVPMTTVWARSSGVGVPAASSFLRPFAFWDGSTFAAIAQSGYPSGPVQLAPGASGHLWAYFPGFPLLVHLVGYVVTSTIAAGIVVNAVCELVALIFLAKLILLERDEASARFGCWALAVFPYAFYLTALYSESTFLAATTASLYYMRRGADGRASVAAAAAMLTRITGIALIPALILSHLMRRRGRPGWGLAWILASLLAPLAFLGYAWGLTGDPLAWWHVEQSESFNRSFAWPWNGASTTLQAFVHGVGDNSFVFGMEMLFGVAGLLAVVWMAWHWRQIAPAFTAYAGVAWLMAACVVYWLSFPRYELAAVPVYLVLVDLTARHPRVRPAVLVASAGWMGFIASLAATGQFVA